MPNPPFHIIVDNSVVTLVGYVQSAIELHEIQRIVAQTQGILRVENQLHEVLSQRYDDRPVKMMFVDGTGIGGPIVDRLRQLGHTNVMEVQFGGRAPNRKYANMRSYMWGQMRDWLGHGCIDDNARLEQDVTGPDYQHDKHDRIVLEAKERMKKRGLDSPDDGDALALCSRRRFPSRRIGPGGCGRSHREETSDGRLYGMLGGRSDAPGVLARYAGGSVPPRHRDTRRPVTGGDLRRLWADVYGAGRDRALAHGRWGL
ncbi:MAG: BON domain-containing protein [Vicinamibacterales bacterium]